MYGGKSNKKHAYNSQRENIYKEHAHLNKHLKVRLPDIRRVN
jgi:hypothetical protein